MEKRTFTLSYQIEVTLDMDALWPDNDGPEEPTAEDVVKLIDKHGGWNDVIHDWSLDFDADTYVLVHDEQGKVIDRA